jgi:MFS family permease
VTGNAGARATHAGIESSYAWVRLGISFALGAIGGIGMWSFVVALPAVQADFGVARGEASLPFTLTMAGFACGGALMGRLSDRYGIVPPAVCGAILIAFGYVGSSLVSNIWWFAIAQGVIGLGCSSTFGPLMSDISHWFDRRRGMAVAIVSCSNYLAGTIWPPLVQHYVASEGWRTVQMAIGVLCIITMLPLSLMLWRRAPMHEAETSGANAVAARGSLGISSQMLMVLLCIAGVGCCVAMSMPQVHIVAYCGDLGYGPARGSEMLSAMMGFGIISRLASGFVADRIGGLATLLIGSILQGVALFLYLWFDSLVSLYVISALFGLFQGGLVPMYAIIVREYFSPREAGARLGLVLMATLLGMALGGWMSGAIYDFTHSYRAAFLNGIGWNLLNVGIMLWLLRRSGRRLAYA